MRRRYILGYLFLETVVPATKYEGHFCGVDFVPEFPTIDARL